MAKLSRIEQAKQDKLIKAAILKQPHLRYADIARLFGICRDKVQKVAVKENIRRKRGKGGKAYEAR
jgi:hypothetical protein